MIISRSDDITIDIPAIIPFNIGIYVITIAFLASWTEITAKENHPERSIWKIGFYVEDIPKICPFPEKDEHTTTNLPHETDCTKFYKCFLGEGVEQDCPLMTKGDPITRLHYNSREQVCDWPWRAACVHCPEQDENGNWPPGYKISHETDNCRMYYNCIKGEKHLEYCPAGTCFSRTCQECVRDRRGGKGCRENDKCTREGEKIRHECNCQLYYECKNGQKMWRTCDDGFHFDSKTQTCTTPDKSD